MPEIDSKNVLHILDRKVYPGEKARINFNTAKLYTTTSVEVPVIIQRAKKSGPVNIRSSPTLVIDDLYGVLKVQAMESLIYLWE